MSGRGVHFALSAADEEALFKASQAGDDAVLEFIHEDLEERWEREWLYETDKAWNAIHRCLTDGELLYDNGRPPLSLAILGGYQQLEGPDETVSVKPADNVGEIASALEAVTREQLRERYDSLSETDYASQMSPKDFDYTWSNFVGLVEFYRRAAEADRAVVFTVDD